MRRSGVAFGALLLPRNSGWHIFKSKLNYSPWKPRFGPSPSQGRREILRLVWGRELTAGEIASQFDVTHAAISQHLRVLREAQLVSERREGRHRLYRARPEALGELRAYMEAYWREGLQRMKREAELEERRGRRRGARRRGG